MGTIASYIASLVHVHDCVIVPGLGAFVGNHKSVEIVSDKGLFFPPKKEIGFNRSLQHNDGLLCDFIARCEGVSFADAQKRVEAFVAQTLMSLSNRQTVVFDEIGELKKDSLGNILFLPNASSLFLPDSFGLSPFHFAMPHAVSMRHEKHAVEVSQMWLRRVSQRKWVAGVALFVGLFLLTTELQTPESASKGSVIPTVELSLPVEVDEDVAANTVVVADKGDVASEITEPMDQKITSDTDVEAKNDKVLFYLVAASFPEVGAAEDFKNRMVGNGYISSEVVSLDGKNRVAIEKFTTRSEAFAALDNFRQIKGFEKVWLLKNK